MTAVSDVTPAAGTAVSGQGLPRSVLVPRAALLVAVIAVAALTSELEDWQPITLVVALGLVMVVADTVSVWTRYIRVSAGLMVLVTVMALLGAAPAVAIGVFSTVIDSRVNRVRAEYALNNVVIFALLGLVGGVLLDVLGNSFGLDRSDSSYALLVLPVYAFLVAMNLALVTLMYHGLSRTDRWQIFRESGLPGVPLELVKGLIAVGAVFVWAQAGLTAAAGLLVVLVILIPLTRTLGAALKSGDDLLAVRRVSDERAADVARLASDRDRLLSEVLHAERRERARLAESLHDGPMQRLAAMRQNLAEAGDVDHHLDAAIAETRAIISSFHPATVRELGFEASLRAAVAPFPAARSIELTVRSAVDDRALADTILIPVAQELVVNAVKHASPTTIDVQVTEVDGTIIIEVNDDGVGIDASDTDRTVQAGHVGLAMVRRRMEDAGGLLEIATRSDGGTRSRIAVPVR
jgi:signal transduction histidine kinase